MPQPKNGLINLINNQGNRSDNDAPQDQCCFVVFMSFGGLDSQVWVGQQTCGSRRLCPVGQQTCVLYFSCFIFLCVPDFDDGADTVLGINDIWCGSGVIVGP